MFPERESLLREIHVSAEKRILSRIDTSHQCTKGQNDEK